MSRSAHSIVIGALSAAGLAFGLAFPEPALRLWAKEGPVEQLSHGILLVAGLCWAYAASRVLERPRVIAGLMAALCALLLCEEIDWGSVYGVTYLSDLFVHRVGFRNFHNSFKGATYLLFVLPLVLFFAAPARYLGAVAPTRDQRIAFGLVGLFFGLSLPFAIERYYQEWLETLLYALLLSAGIRTIIGAARGASLSKEPKAPAEPPNT